MNRWSVGFVLALTAIAVAEPKHDPVKVDLDDAKAKLPRWGTLRQYPNDDEVRADPFVRVDGTLSMAGRKRGLAHNLDQFREACTTLTKKPEEWRKDLGDRYPFTGKNAVRDRTEFESRTKGKDGPVSVGGVHYRTPEDAWTGLYIEQLRKDFTSEVREKVALDPPPDALTFRAAALLDWLDAYDAPFQNAQLPLRRETMIYAHRTAGLLLPLAKENAKDTPLVPLLEKMSKQNLDENELKGVRTALLSVMGNLMKRSPFFDGLRSLYRLLDAQNERVREANEQGRKSSAAATSCLLVTASARAGTEEAYLDAELEVFEKVRSTKVDHKPAPADQYRALLELCPMLSPETRRLFLDLAFGVAPAKAGTLNEDPSEKTGEREAAWKLLDRTLANLKYLYERGGLGNLACRGLEPKPAGGLALQSSSDGDDKRNKLPERPLKPGAEGLVGHLDSLASRIPVPEAQSWTALDPKSPHRTKNTPFLRPFAEMTSAQDKFIAKHNVEEAKFACGYLSDSTSFFLPSAFGLGYLNRKRGGEGVEVDDGRKNTPTLDPVAKKRLDELLKSYPSDNAWRVLYFEHFLQDLAEAQPTGAWPTGTFISKESLQAMALADWADMTLAERHGKPRAAPRLAAQFLKKFSGDFGWSEKLTEAVQAFGKGTVTGKQAELLRWFIMMRYRDGDEPELPYMHFLLEQMREKPSKEALASTYYPAKVCNRFDQYAQNMFRESFGKHLSLVTQASVGAKDAGEPMLRQLLQACPEISPFRRDQLVDLALDVRVEDLGSTRTQTYSALLLREPRDWDWKKPKTDPKSRKILQGLVWLKDEAERSPKALADFCTSLDETGLEKNSELVKRALAAKRPSEATADKEPPTPTYTPKPLPPKLPAPDKLGFHPIGETPPKDYPALYEANLKALSARCGKQKRRDEGEEGKPLSESGLDEDERKFLAAFVEQTDLRAPKGTILEQKQAWERAEETLPLEAAAILDVFDSDRKQPSLQRIAKKLLDEELPFHDTTPKEYLDALKTLVRENEPTGKNKDEMAIIRKHLLQHTDVNSSSLDRIAERNAARLLFVFAAEQVTAPPAKTQSAKELRHDWLMGFCTNPYSTAQSKLSQLKRK